ncbi:hypothetical protein GCM10018793_05120 [Streptomyces sulfonofaciens]|uniref:Uncharacterized protein n=1 Tax=Streptomyces sulfonofaciens TaxID=68272 RepID=A0A919KSU8_9ACTN|nr:hypothetical protein [Streptomyces sulfonofaciens]GHH70691.1 hypothetical protein GCM10018793_05120 [Streptomyces sulfonofaciens]
MDWFVKEHHCASKGGCTPFEPARPAGTQLDCFDEPRGPHRCNDLAEYLHRHNPHIDVTVVCDRCLTKKQADARAASRRRSATRGAPSP